MFVRNCYDVFIISFACLNTGLSTAMALNASSALSESFQRPILPSQPPFTNISSSCTFSTGTQASALSSLLFISGQLPQAFGSNTPTQVATASKGIASGDPLSAAVIQKANVPSATTSPLSTSAENGMFNQTRQTPPQSASTVLQDTKAPRTADINSIEPYAASPSVENNTASKLPLASVTVASENPLTGINSQSPSSEPSSSSTLKVALATLSPVAPYSNSTQNENKTVVDSAGTLPFNSTFLVGVLYPNASASVSVPTWDYSLYSIAPTGTGEEYASQCEAAQRAWSTYSSEIPVTPATITATDFYDESEMTIFSYETYTTCGFTRIRDPNATSTFTFSALTDIHPETTVNPVITPAPSPICLFGFQDCNTLWDDYAKADASWSSNPNTSVRTISLAQPPTLIVINGEATSLPPRDPLNITAPLLTIGHTTFTPFVETFPYVSPIASTGYDGVLVTEFLTRYTLSLFTRGQVFDFSSIVLEPGKAPQTWTERPTSPPAPLCAPNFVDGNDGAKCTIIAEEVRLMYFPTTASRDMCASAPNEGPIISLPTSIPAQHPLGGNDSSGDIVTINGTAFNMHSAYISFSLVRAFDPDENQVGQDFPGTLLPIASSRIYSLRGNPNFTKTDPNSGPSLLPFSFNWADLNSPIPPSAILGLTSCVSTKGAKPRCVQLPDFDYLPQLVVPPEIRAFDPAWASCGLNLKGMVDPPVALIPVSVLATTTRTAVPLIVAPTAGMTLTDGSPYKTVAGDSGLLPAVTGTVGGDQGDSSESQFVSPEPGNAANGRQGRPDPPDSSSGDPSPNDLAGSDGALGTGSGGDGWIPAPVLNGDGDTSSVGGSALAGSDVESPNVGTSNSGDSSSGGLDLGNIILGGLSPDGPNSVVSGLGGPTSGSGTRGGTVPFYPAPVPGEPNDNGGSSPDEISGLGSGPAIAAPDSMSPAAQGGPVGIGPDGSTVPVGGSDINGSPGFNGAVREVPRTTLTMDSSVYTVAIVSGGIVVNGVRVKPQQTIMINGHAIDAISSNLVMDGIDTITLSQLFEQATSFLGKTAGVGSNNDPQRTDLPPAQVSSSTMLSGAKSPASKGADPTSQSQVDATASSKPKSSQAGVTLRHIPQAYLLPMAILLCFCTIL